MLMIRFSGIDLAEKIGKKDYEVIGVERVNKRPFPPYFTVFFEELEEPKKKQKNSRDNPEKEQSL